MRALRLPTGAPLTLLIWVALLILSFPLAERLPERGSTGGVHLNGAQFARYQQLDLQARIAFRLQGIGPENPQAFVGKYVDLAREAKLPGAARRALILKGGGGFDTALLESCLKAAGRSAADRTRELTLWRSIYGRSGAAPVPHDAERRLRALNLGFLTERAVADAVGRRDGKAAGQRAEALFLSNVTTITNRLLFLLLGQFLAALLGGFLLFWSIGVWIRSTFPRHHMLVNLALVGVATALVAVMSAMAARAAPLPDAASLPAALVGVLIALAAIAVLTVLAMAGAVGQHWLPQAPAAEPKPERWGLWADGFVFYMMLYRWAQLAAAWTVGASSGKPASIPVLAAVQFGSGFVAILYLWWQARRRGVSLAAMGCRMRPADLLYGPLGHAQLVPIVFALGLLAQKLFESNPNTAPNPVIPMMASAGALDRVLLFLMASVGAPILEEFFFRGALYTAFRERMGWVGSALISGILFAALHPMQDWLPILGLGLGFAWLRERRQSLAPGIIAHCLQNTQASLLTLWLSS